MLAISSFPNTNPTKDEIQGEMEISTSFNHQDFPDFSSDGNLLDGIDLDDLFLGINHADDLLPDLEMDTQLLAKFSSCEEYSSSVVSHEKSESHHDFQKDERSSSSSSRGGEENVLMSSEKDESRVGTNKESERGKKSSSQQKSSNISNNNKRKLKVDWTPELHRRFVQAVEQLGVDKAVPSRILELMGIDCLTRHNIASHLQKYRSHRKHLLAREAEAANWSTHKRQVYSSAVAGGGGGGKRDIMSPWVASGTINGFPPIMHHHRPPSINHFRPLHVWGHPSMDSSLIHMWPKHLGHNLPSSPPPMSPPAWVAPPRPLPSDPSYWHPHFRASNGLTPGTPCFPQPIGTTRFTAQPVPGIPPSGLAAMPPSIHVSVGQTNQVPPFDIQPTKESIDAAIGDVITKPWLPLPLGLKAPGIDSVLVELQRQGVPNLPPNFGLNQTHQRS